VCGEVERVTYENESTGFRVVRVGGIEGRGKVPVVGVFPPVSVGAQIRATGSWVMDRKHGEQFRVESLVEAMPDTLAGLEKYLGSGLIPGVGAGFAKRIVSKFGTDTLRVLDEQPERLKEVTGLGRTRIDSVTESWKKHRAVSNLMLLLQTHGASPRLAARIIERYGDRSARVLQQSPYRLALEVQGVGFKTADRIAQSLGISGDHPERAQAGVVHELGSLADQGHVCCERTQLVERTAMMLEIDAVHVEEAIDKLWSSERVVVEGDTVYSFRLHEAEVTVAQELQRLSEHSTDPLPGFEKAIEAFEKRGGIELATQQRAAVEAAAREKVLLITGGPGVGKTTIIRAIVSVLDSANVSVRLAAPTGRAARRLGEATSRTATTLHRLLEFEPRTGRFQRCRESMLDTGAVIVDETSMVDLPLCASLLEAMPDDARLILVGDADQLPSVGPGAVLRDLLASDGVRKVRLDEVFRQAGESGIVVNAHRILHGEKPESAGRDEPGADFFIIERSDPEHAAATIESLVTERIPKRFGIDPIRDLQVLTPMHRGAVGTQALNARLQELLNPTGPALERGFMRIRLGDKVMQTRNDYEREVFNGDVGTVSFVDNEERALRVRFDDREVEYDDNALDALTLAYATSIHKSQGSEYPAVVLPLLTAHFVMLSRSLLYTAVTRAKKLCVLVADPKAVGLALSELRAGERATGLRARIRGVL
jgi:exodeoxyribonuclease V alpha subunit